MNINSDTTRGSDAGSTRIRPSCAGRGPAAPQPFITTPASRPPLGHVISSTRDPDAPTGFRLLGRRRWSFITLHPSEGGGSAVSSALLVGSAWFSWAGLTLRVTASRCSCARGAGRTEDGPGRVSSCGFRPQCVVLRMDEADAGVSPGCHVLA